MIATKQYPETIKSLIKNAEPYFLSDSYINQIVLSKKWSEHGSNLDECEELFDNMGVDPDKTLKCSLKLKSMLTKWIPLRLRYIASEMEYELNNSTTIYRAISVKPEKLTETVNKLNAAKTVSDFGCYWSSSEYVQPWGAKTNKGDKTIYIKMELPLEALDIIETLRSRIDFNNGDDEQEYNLKGCFPVKDFSITND
ncbi:hypothetical protein QX249_09930 [Vibrio parahaemolyticus]|uniref:DUF2313 domain-containing protein n=1 Tax=Vibrio parahaemolyticus TaxID=670 RepID=A0AAW8PXN2_VIBPH|nr:hypothetical protein [Vibrio parahaemolyticus]EGR2229581.1 hypothetical protein [Vibrio parahaemolyticus]MDS1820976.1 hypothetical protein [Vibrio parahaemolyticus]